MRVLTPSDVDRILEHWDCPVNFHKLSEENKLRYLIELTEQWVMESLKANWCKPEEEGLDSVTVCAYRRNHREQVNSKAVEADDPAEAYWEYWLDPKNHPPEDEWDL